MGWATRRSWNQPSARSETAQHRLHRLEDDARVRRQRKIFDVVGVAAQLFAHVVGALAIPLRDLGLAGNPRPHVMAYPVEWNLFQKLLHKNRRLRARTDDAHFAVQDVVKLRQLVEAKLAQKRPHAGDARVAALCGYGQPPAAGLWNMV